MRCVVGVRRREIMERRVFIPICEGLLLIAVHSVVAPEYAMFQRVFRHLRFIVRQKRTRWLYFFVSLLLKKRGFEVCAVPQRDLRR